MIIVIYLFIQEAHNKDKHSHTIIVLSEKNYRYTSEVNFQILNMKEDGQENEVTEREECEEEEEEGEEGGKGDNSAAKTPVSLLQVACKEELKMICLHLDQLHNDRSCM